MDTNDQRAIEALFDKLAAVSKQAPRDAQAEAFIREEISRQPGAPYYMAQTIVVQEQALEAAQRRIEELERQEQAQPQGGSGGLFGGLFGGNDRAQTRRPSAAVPSTGGSRSASGSKWGSGAGAADQSRFGSGRGMGGMGAMGGGIGGGGFLAGAAQTAMGVAGGVLLGNAIGGMFGGDDTPAAEAPEQAAAAEPDAQDAQVENASYDDAGGFDDGGDFGEV